jgi:protein tyrosine phosphatase
MHKVESCYCNCNACNDIVVTDDVTRVILMGGTSGDYINANYVNMEIPGSGIINRYIATQGNGVSTAVNVVIVTTLSDSSLQLGG